MRRATLILNPRAGRGLSLAAIVPAIIHTLADHNVVASSIATTAPGAAGIIAAAAAARGDEIVFACGGDGTVHEVLQGLVGTRTALGIIPIGTANALARDLGISRDPVQAAAQQANAAAVHIPVGQVKYRSTQGGNAEMHRYFTVMAGAGPDGALVYSLLTAQKSALGRSAYYAHAARLFLTRSFQTFRVAYRLTGSAQWEHDTAVSVMAARIGSLGGAFGRLTNGCSVHGESLRLILVRPPARVGLAAWFVFGHLGISQFNPWLQTLDVEEFRCESLHRQDRVYSQVDGEWMGALPISVCLASDTLLLLTPERQPQKAPRSKIGRMR